MDLCPRWRGSDSGGENAPTWYTGLLIGNTYRPLLRDQGTHVNNGFVRSVRRAFG